MCLCGFVESENLDVQICFCSDIYRKNTSVRSSHQMHLMRCFVFICACVELNIMIYDHVIILVVLVLCFLSSHRFGTKKSISQSAKEPGFSMFRKEKKREDVGGGEEEGGK